MLWFPDELSAKGARIVGAQFLGDLLKLQLNPKHDHVQPVRQKLTYLGVDLWPAGIRLQPRVQRRISTRLTLENAASYQTLVHYYLPKRYAKRFSWEIVDTLDEI